MKKFALLLVACSIGVFSLTGCGKTDKTKTDKTEDKTKTEKTKTE